MLFSTDAFALPELYLVSTLGFRRALTGVLRGGVRDGAWTSADADRFAGMVTSGNARRAYALDAG